MPENLSNSNGFSSPSLSEDDEMVMDISGLSDPSQQQEQSKQGDEGRQNQEDRPHQTEEISAARLAMGIEDGEDKVLKWSQLTEEELNRYEMFRRSTFPKASIKRLMQSISGSTVSPNVVIAMSGIAKVFVGELVVEAIKIQKRYGESGPIEPKHLREAYRVIKNRSNKTVNIQ